MTSPTPLESVLNFLRAIEAGGGPAEIAPLLAEDYTLSEAPHLLAPAGATRNRDEALAGAAAAHQVVSGQRFLVRRTTCEGTRVVLEADWSATLLMDLPHWNSGEVIRARIAAVFEVRDGTIVSQDSYDCYFAPA
ncbi:nuclear transport factor 2 family protein [Arthrobacter sp. H16F315]|uniref:nuclear transport factor 2 family protein n=1 Tax=Arthrobacter sp. H16F315 TaxID=2955314 RepID=UPI002096D939|nr:nuclear transport factor 2 family protein [Arthrobacter sp. H16F315]MDD1477558.1 nuclear transport factor 2 family protein [Arthrobacter sp. H16F315]